MTKYYVVIPCAGSGNRFGSELPKQYHEICGQTVLDWCLQAFISITEIEQIVLVANPEDVQINNYSQYAKVSIQRIGGKTRAQSVLNGINQINCADDDWILVHDAARCCIKTSDIVNLIYQLQNHAVGGILAQKAVDTIKQVNTAGEIVATLNRQFIYQAQTPQMFRAGLLKHALLHSNPELITDEASAIESRGLTPQVIECGSHNFKITYPHDLKLAEVFISANLEKIANV